MRVHDIPELNTENYQDHLLFWPIGQLLTQTRTQHFGSQTSRRNPRRDRGIGWQSSLAQIPWELHETPWRYLLLVPNPDSWRNAQRGAQGGSGLGNVCFAGSQS